jgi:hypothetical protein
MVRPRESRRLTICYWGAWCAGPLRPRVGEISSAMRPTQSQGDTHDTDGTETERIRRSGQFRRVGASHHTLKDCSNDFEGVGLTLPRNRRPERLIRSLSVQSVSWQCPLGLSGSNCSGPGATARATATTTGDQTAVTPWRPSGRVPRPSRPSIRLDRATRAGRTAAPARSRGPQAGSTAPGPCRGRMGPAARPAARAGG